MLLAAAILFVVVVIVLVFSRGRSDDENYTLVDDDGDDDGRARASVAFTFTTFLTKHGRYRKFARIMKQLAKDRLDLIDRFIVVNEYDPENDARSRELVARLQEKFPFLRIIQKRAHERGQARSLNMILDEIVPSFHYWIHWEETWIPRRNFIKKSIGILENHREIGQLQLAEGWRDVGADRLKKAAGYAEVRLHPRFPDICPDKLTRAQDAAAQYETLCREHGLDVVWPLYSLRPSVVRISSLRNDRFEEDDALWPITFEYRFGLRWIQNNRMAVSEPPAAYRMENHRSTYA